MSGIQEAVRRGLVYLAGKVKEGAYGEDDDAFQNENDAAAFLEDLEDEVTGKMS